MREQLQEQERREAEKQQQERLFTTQTSALQVPKNIQSIGVDVPSQVLQVRTVLENPTRYHVMQKQKLQVRQYLSESKDHQHDEGDGRVCVGESHSAPMVVSGPLATNNLQKPFHPHYQQHATSPDPAMSPALSSVATSTSEGDPERDDVTMWPNALKELGVEEDRRTERGFQDL
ncbi:unnamed protein product [Timema podura]|uniref:MiT/TFE transcription factors N-terminal domain-containing protein n=1 Tax=Timema podura TaxID=61482 RepID=A0ABN7NSU8_TIMPD|nr:unnamed protein product [Timema podura]